MEILLGVRACDPAAAEHSLISALGEPSQRKPKHLFWRGKAAFIAAQLPAEARRCEVNFVTTKDKARISDLFNGDSGDKGDDGAEALPPAGSDENPAAPPAGGDKGGAAGR